MLNKSKIVLFALAISASQQLEAQTKRIAYRSHSHHSYGNYLREPDNLGQIQMHFPERKIEPITTAPIEEPKKDSVKKTKQSIEEINKPNVAPSTNHKKTKIKFLRFKKQTKVVSPTIPPSQRTVPKKEIKRQNTGQQRGAIYPLLIWGAALVFVFGSLLKKREESEIGI